MHLGAFDEGNSTDMPSPQKELFDVVENAFELTEDVDEEDIGKEDTLIVVPSDVGVKGTFESEGEIVMTPTSEILEESVWPQSVKDAADAKHGEAAAKSLPKDEEMIVKNENSGPPSVPDTVEDNFASEAQPILVDMQSSESSEEANSPKMTPRPLSPNTTEYILSKSPKSAKKLVKDFVASVMMDEKKTDELPNMSQVCGKFRILF